MKKRTALRNSLQRLKYEFPLQFEEIDINGVEIYIDVEERKERRKIVEILRMHRSKWALIALIILEHRYDEDLYAKEPFNTVAIKFKFGRTNPRIYRLEFRRHNEKKKVVMVRGILNKASQKIRGTLKDQLRAIKDFEYEFFNNPRDAINHRQQQ